MCVYGKPWIGFLHSVERLLYIYSSDLDFMSSASYPAGGFTIGTYDVVSLNILWFSVVSESILHRGVCGRGIHAAPGMCHSTNGNQE